MCHRTEARLQGETAPARARQIVRKQCADLQFDDLVDTATLLTSELVSNAVVHATGPLALGVACTHGRLVISVRDANPRLPRIRRAAVRDVNGRGLALVSKLAEHWGFREVPQDGKTVWFALRPRRSQSNRSACACPGETFETALVSDRVSGGTSVSVPASRIAY
jgi:anti-sigma regulatory factor (Ser/Thr protein kinase)